MKYAYCSLILVAVLLLAPSIAIAQASLRSVERDWQRAADDVARRQALTALAEINSPEAAEFLIDVLSRDAAARNPRARLSTAIRERAVKTLASFTHEEAHEKIGAAVRAMNSDVNHIRALEQFELMYALASNNESETAAGEVRSTLQITGSPWLAMATVEAVRQAELDNPGAGRRFLPEVLGMLAASRSDIHKQELTTVNVMTCLSALVQKGEPEALEVVRAIVDWQVWSRNTVIRLRDIADRVLVKLTDEDCTLTNDTIPFWQWWLANQTAEEQGEQPRKQSRTAPVIFKQPVVGTRIVLVLDVSDSMKWPIARESRDEMKARASHLDWTRIESAMDLAIEELVHSLENLKPKPAVAGERGGRGTRPGREDVVDETRHFAIILYSRDVTNFTEGWRVASVQEIDRWIDRVRQLRPESTTNIHGGLLEAFGLSEKKGRAQHPEIDRDCVLTGAHTIVFMTDGYATWSEDSESQTAEDAWGNPVGDGKYVQRDNLLALARRLNRFRKVLINTVGIGIHDEQLMRGLAKDSGGQYTDWGCKIDFR